MLTHNHRETKRRTKQREPRAFVQEFSRPQLGDFLRLLARVWANSGKLACSCVVSAVQTECLLWPLALHHHVQTELQPRVSLPLRPPELRLRMHADQAELPPICLRNTRPYHVRKSFGVGIS